MVATPATSPKMDVGRQAQKIAGGIERDFARLLGEQRAGESEPAKTSVAAKREYVTYLPP